MLRTLAGIVSPAGPRARLAILIFHRVLPAPDAMLDEVDAARFDRLVAFLASNFNVLALGEAVAGLARGRLPSRAVAITFDDGYANNEEVALPILLRHGVAATFFVSTGYLDGTAMFNDDVIEIVRTAPPGEYDLSPLGLPSCSLADDKTRRDAIEPLLARLKYRPPAERRETVAALARTLGGRPATNLMMRPAQVRTLAEAGMEIGGHTVNHPILAQVDDDTARREILDGKHTLEEITGRPVSLFAYPNGRPGQDYGSRDVRLARESGFTAAVSTRDGVAAPGADLFQLPRCTPWERDPRRLGLRLVVNCLKAVAA